MVVLAAAYGLPALWPDVRKAVAGVAEIAPAVLLGALVLETASLACFSGLTVSLLGRARRPRFGTLLRIDVTVGGLSRVLPAAAATGGALRLRLLTAAGVSHPDAVFLATIEGTGSALLLYVMMGVALIISLPVHGFGDPGQILAAVAGVVLVAVASALLSAVARDGRGLRRLIAWLARWVPGMNADHATATLHREAEHLRALAADPPRLVAAVAWGAANWLLDAAVLWGILAAVGYIIDPLTLFIAYAVASVLGLLPITPGGVGVVEGVLVPSLVAAGVPAHLALVAVLAWRLVSFWLPIPVGALMWLTVRHHEPLGAAAREQPLRDDHHQQEGTADHGLDVAVEPADLVDHVGQHVAQQHPDERAQHAARAAGEQGAADDDGGDRVQLGADPDHRHARLQVGRRERAGEPGQHAARGVDDDLGAGHGQAHSRADASAPPMAKTVSPNRVRCSTTPPMPHRTSAIHTGTPSPRTVARPSPSTTGSEIVYVVLPSWVSASSRPRANSSVASVTMKGARPRRATSRPLTSPISPHTARGSASAATGPACEP